MNRTLKIIAATLALIMLLPMAIACNNGDGDDTTAPADTTATPTPDTSSDNTSAPAETEDETTAAPETTEEPQKEVRSLKILAIGNSFSTDAMQYLWQICRDGGVEDITLGNLYYGGCSIDQHLSFAKTDSASYKYYKNTDGEWKKTENYKMSSALADEEWDIITFQQTSKTCGLASSYKNLKSLVDHVEKAAPNARFMFHMTWAYQQDSTHASFPNYDKSQQKMYDMTIDCTRDCILTETRFETVIPCMTSIQNARTSFLGDTLTRDGYHLDYNIGRYIAGLTWYAVLTGGDVDAITYNPAPDAISEDMLAVAREAVKNALATPLAVTESKIKEGTRPSGSSSDDPTVELVPADFFEADKILAEKNGVDLTGYTLLDWGYLENTYWNCTSKAGTQTPGASNSTYHQNVCSDRKFSIDELPLGSIFIADEGWQYRIDIYTDAEQKYAGKRPGMITQRFYQLDSALMSDATLLAWNISANPKRDISAIYAQAACHLRIYVPNK